MKNAIVLICTMLSVTACSQYSSDDATSVTTVERLDVSKRYLISPQRSWESDVFLIGWKASANVGYDISILTEEEKDPSCHPLVAPVA